MNELRNLLRAGGAAGVTGVGALATLISGCPDPDPMSADAFRAPDAFVAPDAFMEPTPDAFVPPPDAFVAPDAFARTCPAVSARDTVTVSGTISADTTWTCDHNYLLEASGDQGPVYERLPCARAFSHRCTQ